MIPASPVGSVSSRLGAWRRVPWAKVGIGIAMAGFSGVAVAVAPGSAWANQLCDIDPDGSAAVPGAMPNLSDSFGRDVCQVLTMPTASRSEGDRFLKQIDPESLLTNTSASADAMTLPSLWWTRDSIPPQLGRHRLVDSWVSYTIQDADVRVVDVMINGQFWRALSMPQRYGVLSNFGNSAQEFGYQLRFFQNNGYSARMIGLYACEAPENTTGNTASAPAIFSMTHCLVTVDIPRITQLQQAMRPPSTMPTATAPDVIPAAEDAVSLAVAEDSVSP